MRIEHKDTLNRDYLQLGVQTNPGCEFLKALWLADRWSPRRAKSFSIIDFVETTYSKLPVDLYEGPTGYARIRVVYYTTSKEGHFKVGEFDHYTTLQHDRFERLIVENQRSCSHQLDEQGFCEKCYAYTHDRVVHLEDGSTLPLEN